MKLRNVAVSDVLPRVAYGCSDIVVFVTEESLSTSTAMESALKFSSRQAKKMSAPAPILFIISNRRDPSREDLDPQETTKEFLKEHDEDGLLAENYSSVIVFRVPDWSHGR